MRYREPRYPCDTDLTVLHDGAARPARLVNLGYGGGRIDGLGTIPRGATVILCHIGARYPAVVIWSGPKRTGLRFLQRLTSAQLAALRRVGAHDGEGWLSAFPGAFREMA